MLGLGGSGVQRFSAQGLRAFGVEGLGFGVQGLLFRDSVIREYNTTEHATVMG